MNEWRRRAMIYEVYPRSFQDTNGDGIGDLVGVDTVWVSPFKKSPMADCGYDVEDFRTVDPMFGTIGDVDALLQKAHKLGL